jgi:hypothetical protein
MPASAPKAPSAPTHAATKAQPAPPAAVAKLEVPAGGPFVPASYHSASPARTGGDQPADAQRLLATAVFVAGSARLEPGRRYNLAIRSSRFLVLGPADLDPTAVVLDRDVADIEARSLDGRLVLSEPNSRSGLVLAFMGVAGPSTANLASMISEAAAS